MSDEHELDPELDPVQEAHIRALLADLGSTPTEAIPDDVAARLDATLAGLEEERTASGPGSESGDGSDEPSTVVPLRRRWAPRIAAAAAAVIVVGIGGVTVANLGGVDGLTSSAGSDSKAADDGGAAAGQAESAPETASPSAPAADSDSLGGKALAVPAVRSATFEADAARILGGDRAAEDSSLSKDPLAVAGQETARNQLRVSGCQGPPVPQGATLSPVRYDGTLAVLLIHPASDGERLVEAWSCAGDQRLDSARVPSANTGLASPSPSP